MAQAIKKKIVVCGGNGFLGSRICKFAVQRGWDVISISRSGEPTWSSVTSSPTSPQWSSKVTWHKANILHPSEYSQALDSADTVVHSMGILLEADYKGVLQGKESPLSALQRLYASARPGSSANPLDELPGKDTEPAGGPLTYELMNRDSAILLARESSAGRVPTFIYISAAAGAPLLPSRYLETKRAAESTISTHLSTTTSPTEPHKPHTMRNVFLRPAFLYDSSRAFTMPIAAAAGIASSIDAGGILSRVFGAAALKPQKADDVARAVVESAEDELVRGAVEGPEIEELATRAWRKEMM